MIGKNQNNRQWFSIKIAVLKNFTKLKGKHQHARLLFLVKLQAENGNFFKKWLLYRCFPVNFNKFLGILFWQKTSGQLLLKNSWRELFSWFHSILKSLLPSLAFKIIYSVLVCFSKETGPPQALSYWGGNIFQNRTPFKASEATSFRKRSRLQY